MKGLATHNPKIVVIDSGVYANHPRLKSFEFQGISIRTNTLDEIEISTDISDDLGHGTAVTNIIKTHNKNAELFIVKLFCDRISETNEDVLLVALRYIYENVLCDIINLSLGLSIVSKKQEFDTICKKISDEGVVIVAAFDNHGSMSFPALLDSVIGVSTGEHCIRTTDIEIVENSEVNVCAKGGIQRLAWTTPEYVFSMGNSFACAHITGILSHRHLNGISDAMEYLRKQALFIYHFAPKESISFAEPFLYAEQRAILFPFNKEMHSIIRFIHQVIPIVVDVYDVKHTARIGTSTNHLLGIDQAENYIIKNIENVDWESFDLCILGHVSEVESLAHCSKAIDQFLSGMALHKKRIYSFEQLGSRQHLVCEKYLFSPDVLKAAVVAPFGKLFKQSKPIVGVFGTSSKQGKFTLQLILRELFVNAGYNIKQIGTEPSAYLFGMDECFHFGYQSHTNMTRFEAVEYLNRRIYDLSTDDVDLIISGCQSGTIPYNTSNLYDYTLPQIEFLLGLQPDAVVLCINLFDEKDLISRTIQFIESCVVCKVVALVLFPMDIPEQGEGLYNNRVLISKEKLDALKKDLDQLYRIPIYLLGNDSDMQCLFHDIVNFFG